MGGKISSRRAFSNKIRIKTNFLLYVQEYLEYAVEHFPTK